MSASFAQAPPASSSGAKRPAAETPAAGASPGVSVEELAACPIFGALTPSQKQEFADLAVPREFAAGETILHEGRTTRALWFILSGTCEVVKEVGGGERRLALLERGALFGEMSFFAPGPHSASVRALSAVRLVQMTAEGWAELERVGLRPAFRIASEVAAVMAARLARMDEWVREMLAKDHDAARRDEWDEFRETLLSGER